VEFKRLGGMGTKGLKLIKEKYLIPSYDKNPIKHNCLILSMKR
jgi:hypothetical protein